MTRHTDLPDQVHLVGSIGIATECGVARARQRDWVHGILDTYAGASRNPE